MAEEQPEGEQPVQDEAAVEMIHEEPPSEDEEVDASGTACHLVHPPCRLWCGRHWMWTKRDRRGDFEEA